jgi:hypothetical protein
MSTIQGPPSDGEVARAALIQSVVSNVAMLAIVVALNVAVAKRDAITRAARRTVASVRQDARQDRERRALAEFRAEVAEISHAERLDGEP